MYEYFLNHIYISLDIIILIIFWIPIFILSKSSRKWMLIMSLFGMALGLPIIQDTYIRDWWSPKYMFPLSYLKIEDIFFGFIITGLVSSLYSFLKSKVNFNIEKNNNSLLYKIGIVIIVFSIYLILVYLLNIHSFLATIIGAIFIAAITYYKKLPYLKSAIYTGLITAIFAMPIYLIGIHLNPDYINTEWLLDKLSGIMLLGVPIEEFGWFISVGIGLSAFQENFE